MPQSYVPAGYEDISDDDDDCLFFCDPLPSQNSTCIAEEKLNGVFEPNPCYYGPTVTIENENRKDENELCDQNANEIHNDNHSIDDEEYFFDAGTQQDEFDDNENDDKLIKNVVESILDKCVKESSLKESSNIDLEDISAQTLLNSTLNLTLDIGDSVSDFETIGINSQSSACDVTGWKTDNSVKIPTEEEILATSTQLIPSEPKEDLIEEQKSFITETEANKTDELTTFVEEPKLNDWNSNWTSEGNNEKKDANQKKKEFEEPNLSDWACNWTSKCNEEEQDANQEKEEFEEEKPKNPDKDLISQIKAENEEISIEEKDERKFKTFREDIELFLSACTLDKFIPNFLRHNINLRDLLLFNEEDLKRVGIEKYGDQILIMQAIKKAHCKEWRPSSLPLIQEQTIISCPDATNIIKNIKDHFEYMQTTVKYLRERIVRDPECLERGKDIIDINCFQRLLINSHKSLEILDVEILRLSDELDLVKTDAHLSDIDLIEHVPDRELIEVKRLNKTPILAMTGTILLGSLLAYRYVIS